MESGINNTTSIIIPLKVVVIGDNNTGKYTIQKFMFFNFRQNYIFEISLKQQGK